MTAATRDLDCKLGRSAGELGKNGSSGDKTGRDWGDIMKGEVIAFDQATGKGVIRGEKDEKRYSFVAAQWKSDFAAVAGEIVDFEVRKRQAVEIYSMRRPIIPAQFSEVTSQVKEKLKSAGIDNLTSAKSLKEFTFSNIYLVAPAIMLVSCLLPYFALPGMMQQMAQAYAPNLSLSTSLFGLGSFVGTVIDLARMMGGRQSDTFVNLMRLSYLFYAIPGFAAYLIWSEYNGRKIDWLRLTTGLVSLAPLALILLALIFGAFSGSKPGEPSISPFSLLSIGFYLTTACGAALTTAHMGWFDSGNRPDQNESSIPPDDEDQQARSEPTLYEPQLAENHESVEQTTESAIIAIQSEKLYDVPAKLNAVTSTDGNTLAAVAVLSIFAFGFIMYNATSASQVGGSSGTATETKAGPTTVKKSQEALGRNAQTDKVKAYRDKAERGDAEAAYQLGLAYRKGDGVIQSNELAAFWFQKYAENKKTASVVKRNSVTPPIDTRKQEVATYQEKKEPSLREKAERGDEVAAYQLGQAYLAGDGVTQSQEQAVYWFRQAAEQGYADAQVSLGWMYEMGHGIAKDDELAASWYREAAVKKNQIGQTNLGSMYQRGRGVAKDDKLAVFWYSSAAFQGHARAQGLLGWMYAMGRGIDRDDQTAVSWFRKAAEQEDAYAQDNLGYMYANGHGVDRDDQLAVHWYQKAAEQGNKHAISELKNRGLM
jgi:TPR repeat protein